MNAHDKVQKVIDGLAAEATRLHEHADHQTVPDFRHRARSRAGFIDKIVKDLQEAIA